MKESKKLTGTKVKATKGKRVSLRCPLSIDHTDLEHNYDAGCAQVCLTLENMGGGGVTNDSVESAIVVIRLYDAQGALVPCNKNEYFAKMLRFGEEGLQSGAQISFRLTPDCDGGLRVADLEVYISRVRYADGSVTDYLRGDFFDMPGDALPLQKKHKKELDAITAKFGANAKYEPEELTEIIWRCTCGEFCESDQCSTCGTSKKELFDYFKGGEKSAGALPLGTLPDYADPASDDPTASEPSSALPTDATTEYDTDTFVAGMLSMNGDGEAGESDERTTDASDDSEVPTLRPAPEEKGTDKLKIGLIIAIVASGAVLIVIIILLILAMAARSGSPDDTSRSDSDNTTPLVTTTTAPDDPDDPDDPDVPDDPPVSDDEKLVRTYLERNEFDNALGYARMAELGDALIEEILTTAIDYYTNVEPDIEKAMQYAEELGDASAVDALVLGQYNDAMDKGDYTAAIGYAEKLLTDKDAKLTAAAEALLQSQMTAGNYDDALKTAEQYPTTTKVEDVALSAISYYISAQDFDKALALAEENDYGEQTASIAKAAVDHYISVGNYDRAADYVTLTGDPDDVSLLLSSLSESAIQKHLPTFFSSLSFKQKQAVHASVMDSAAHAGVIDVYGNAYWDTDQAHTVVETGKTVVSIKVSKFSTVLLFSDGTVAVHSKNSAQTYDVSLWTDIVAIDAGDYHVVGLKADGTVVATGDNSYGQCDVNGIGDAVAIDAGGYHTLILRANGTVAAVGMNSSKQCNTSAWTDIVAISAGRLHSVGLKADGTAVAAGSSSGGRCDVDEWSDVIRISAGESCTVGLKADGTLLLATGDTASGDVSTMTNVVWVSAGSGSVTALQSNGTLVTTGTTPPDLSFVSTHELVTDIYGND